MAIGLAVRITDISGNSLRFDTSGRIVLNAADMSGATVTQTYGNVTVPTWLTLTGASGGTVLTSQACSSVRIVSLSGNGYILVGGTGTSAPVSGTQGIPLSTTPLDFPVSNANLLRAVAHTSGNQIAVMTFG